MISDTFATVVDVKISYQVSLCTTEGITTTNPLSPHNLDDTFSSTTILQEYHKTQHIVVSHPFV